MKVKPADTHGSRRYHVQMRSGKRDNKMLDGGHFESLDEALQKASQMRHSQQKKQRCMPVANSERTPLKFEILHYSPCGMCSRLGSLPF